ncbi:MAG: disulfide bond formation protein B [Luminiphilus sp.]
MTQSPTMRSLWWAMLILGSGMFAAALYWQYALGEDPCQVCIHARLWVVAIALIGALMLVLPSNRGTGFGGLVLLLVSSMGLGERSYYLYEIENFRGDGSCQFTLGMPDWFAVDRWFPALFEVRNICSYTPEIAFGISMAEALVVISVLIVAISASAGVKLLTNMPSGGTA